MIYDGTWACNSRSKENDGDRMPLSEFHVWIDINMVEILIFNFIKKFKDM